MTAPKGYTQHDEVIEVPRGTGIAGFMRAIGEVLKLPRVQNIHITNQGKIEYSFFLRDGEAKRILTMQFDDLQPMALVRNAEIQEVLGRSTLATTALLQMFNASALDHLAPIAFITGAATTFWQWFEHSSGIPIPMRDSLMGVPVYKDRTCPDEVLLLCTAFKKDSELVDMKKAYKIDIPQVTP